MKIDFVKALMVIAVAVPLVGSIFASIIFIGLFIGVLIDTTTSGVISVPTAISDLFVNLTNDFVAIVLSISDNTALAVGLLAIVVLLALFGGWILIGNYKKGKGGPKI